MYFGKNKLFGLGHTNKIEFSKLQNSLAKFDSVFLLMLVKFKVFCVDVLKTIKELHIY